MDANKSKKKVYQNVYIKSLLTRKVNIPFKHVGNNIKKTIEQMIKHTIEGKCSVEGYIKPNSTNILSYSSGLLQDNSVYFDVSFECLVCCPVEGMLIKCKAKNISQAGIRALIDGKEKSPVVIYLSRDHHYNNKGFVNVKEDEMITVRVIGQRFELNDEQVSVIGELVENKIPKKGKKAKLIISENI
jgi:DNA-directed RNA polymerase subunit E'/Rpb7